jgi:hypothetical protein
VCHALLLAPLSFHHRTALSQHPTPPAQLAAAVAVLADPSLHTRLPPDATGAAAKLASLARRDAIVTASLAWSALALQGLALALAAALQPDGDADGEAAAESEEEAWAAIEAAAIVRGMPRAPSGMRAPLLPGHAARGVRADASRAAEDEWSQRMCVPACAKMPLHVSGCHQH